MITSAIVIDGTTWTISGNDQLGLSSEPRITATANGVTAEVNYRYRQITSTHHTGDCTWGVNLSPICTCAPRPTDEAALFAAVLDIQDRCCAARDAAEKADREAREATGDTLVRIPSGCEGCPSAIHGGTCTCC